MKKGENNLGVHVTLPPLKAWNGYPFMNDTTELLRLDTCDVMNEYVTNIVRAVEQPG